MTKEAVKEILNGRFESEDDRKYWERKLAEMERKERNAKENEKYFREMARYSR